MTEDGVTERMVDRALSRVRQTPPPRVAVVGAGVEGESLARWFRRQGASVVVHLARTAQQVAADPALARQARVFADIGAELSLGSDYLKGVPEADIVGVVQSAYTYKYPMNLAALVLALRNGAPIVTNIGLFLALCPCPVIGITGTNGKTTTTEMTDAILRAGGLAVHTGGNIGASPLDDVEALTPGDLVLLELSNYQLQLVDRSPHVSAVTNLAADHLVDYGGSFEDYIAAKKRILDFQTADDWAVLNWDDPILRRWGALAQGQLFAFNLSHSMEPGAYVKKDVITIRHDGRERPVMPVADLGVPGAHNLANALCAVAIGAIQGVAPDAMAAALRAYRSGPHRLEQVAEIGGVTWVNDSKSTTPASSVAAICAFPGRPIVLLAGGKDKALPLDDLLAAIRQHTRALVTFGEWGPSLAAAARAAGAAEVHEGGSLSDAVALAAGLARPGEIVLLSPAGTSFDAYPSYAARGDHFKTLVKGLE
ncbi:MAG: UDP-N-acetylmuramoyl-L-alanine--D-glutamate ligase [Anaerolineae bacterium]